MFKQRPFPAAGVLEGPTQMFQELETITSVCPWFYSLEPIFKCQAICWSALGLPISTRATSVTWKGTEGFSGDSAEGWQPSAKHSQAALPPEPVHRCQKPRGVSERTRHIRAHVKTPEDRAGVFPWSVGRRSRTSVSLGEWVHTHATQCVCLCLCAMHAT